MRLRSRIHKGGLVAAATSAPGAAAARVGEDQDYRDHDRDQEHGEYHPPRPGPGPQSASLRLLLLKCGHKITFLFWTAWKERSPNSGGRKPALLSRSQLAFCRRGGCC